MKKLGIKILLLGLGLLGFLYLINYYVGIAFQEESLHSAPAPLLLLWLSIILLFGKIASGVIERLNKPPVLGELLVGLILGNVALIGITFLDDMKTTPVINALAQLGAIILYFQAGLSSNLENIRKFWKQSVLIAILGLAASFGLYVLVLPYLFPGLDEIVYFFVAFALSPTGTGVAARVLQDLGMIEEQDAQLVLSTGAIDNMISYVVLAIFTGIISSGTVDTMFTATIVGKVILFLAGVFLFCLIALQPLAKFIASIYSGRALKFGFTFSIALLCAFLAQSIGISPIIGAFAAGLAINPHYFDFFKFASFFTDFEKDIIRSHEKGASRKIAESKSHDLEDMFTTPAFLLVTIFFVVSGMAVSLPDIAKIEFILSGLVILVIAVFSKFAAVFTVRGSFQNILAAGLVPRVTTTLVFATVGKGLGILPTNVYSMIIFVVMLTAFTSPILISAFAKRQNKVA